MKTLALCGKFLPASLRCQTGAVRAEFPPLHDALGRRKPAQSFSPPTADHDIDRNPRFRNPGGSRALLRESLFPGYQRGTIACAIRTNWFRLKKSFQIQKWLFQYFPRQRGEREARNEDDGKGKYGFRSR